jgi:hypothetical protein
LPDAAIVDSLGAAAGAGAGAGAACDTGAGAGACGTSVVLGVETTERAPFTTPTEPYEPPSLPKPAYDDGNAVKLGALSGFGATGTGAAGVDEPGAAEGLPMGAVVVAEPLSGAIPAIRLSYPERASR